MTSANISDEPIIIDDTLMFEFAHCRLDGVLTNDRRILVPQDDSVLRIMDGRPVFLRRSKGYAPEPVEIGVTERIFAAGGDLKASFALTGGDEPGSCHISQYLGDLDDSGSMEAYKKTFSHLAGLLGIRPERAACDLHPSYRSVAFAGSTGLPVTRVQHHKAHIASVMAERRDRGNVIGVAFDGTGYGEDGSIMGGEFFVCGEDGADAKWKCNRVGHLAEVTAVGGDILAKDAKRMLYFYLAGDGLPVEENDILRAALENRINTVKTTSAGRLFDAVSAMLGICAFNNYEAECAIRLEAAAAEALESGSAPFPLGFGCLNTADGFIIEHKYVFAAIRKALDEGIDAGRISLGFHFALAEAVAETCEMIREKTKIGRVALSGGVFQNRIFFEKTLEPLRDRGFGTLYNEKVPANDGGLALGQAFAAAGG